MDNENVVEVVEAADKETPKRKSKALPRKRKCQVVSYNKYSGIIVYVDAKGELVQTNAIKYDGSGYVTV